MRFAAPDEYQHSNLARRRDLRPDGRGAVHGLCLCADRSRPGNRAAHLLLPCAVRMGRLRGVRAGRDFGRLLPVAGTAGMGRPRLRGGRKRDGLLYAGADHRLDLGQADLGRVVDVIAAALDVPIIIVSVRLWRTIHPAVLVTRQGGHGLEDPRMVATLLVSMAAFTALFVWLLCLRFATLRTQTRLNQVARELGFAHAAAGDL